MTNFQKLTLGVVLFFIALTAITAGCGIQWGVAGSLIGFGVVCIGYGIGAFASIKE